MKQITLFAFATLMTILAINCKKASPTTYDCTTLTNLTYTTNVKSILDASCATSGCHSASTKAAGRDYSSFASVTALAAKAEFMGSMQHQSGYDAMPKGGSKLSDDKLKTISCWINAGMKQ
jgi:cytochrome c553